MIMVTFFIALILLIAGFFTYGKLIEKVFQTDAGRTTPAVAHPDGVDFVPMKTWRIFLIQLLNIAGLGPIYGALAGACWGPRVYLWIVLGSILGGAVHDFLSGMMSERQDGASVSEISYSYLGNIVGNIMRVFSVILLLLIGVNFSVGPAALIGMLTPEWMNTNFWLIIILIYYFCATFLPVDKIIGKLYPVFGVCLIIMATGVLGGLIVSGRMMNLPEMTAAMSIQHPDGTPVWAMMFVTVACGAVSGFHATQSPIMARCITNEKEGRIVFYGAMIAEGVIALIWAAAGVAFYEGVGPLNEALKALGQGSVVYTICQNLLGPVGAVLAMIGVIACPITSGDTALRSARLTIADWFKIDQKSLKARLFMSVPILVIVALVGQLPFQVVWRYFSWSNQTLAMIVLWTGAAYLYRHGFPPLACFMAGIPATFMSAVSMTYLMQAPECFRLPVSIAYPVGIVFALVCLAIFCWRVIYLKKDETLKSPAV